MINFPLINQALVVLINLIGASLSVLVYQQNPKGKVNRVFVFMVILMFLWVDFAYFARAIGPNQIYLAELFLKIAWFVTPLFFTFLYLLVIYLLRKEQEHQFLSKVVVFTGSSIALLTGFTNLVIKGIRFVDGNLAIIYGTGMLPFLGVGFFLICATLYTLIKAYLRFPSERKRKIEYFLVGIFIFYLGNIIFNIILPSVFGIVRFYYIGDYSAIFLLGFTAYAIVRRELFGIKLVLTALLVGLIVVLLLFDVLLTPELTSRSLKAVFLIIFLYLGYSLIQSVLREIKYREELQSAYKELKKLDKAKSEFISIASHQLRTPLTVIQGYVSMILEGTYGSVSEKMIKPMENVFTSSERLIKLVNDLLNVSRIETGKIGIKFERASLEEIIISIVEELKGAAKKKEVYLKWEKPKEALPKILIDKDKMRQVVLNVIDNAIRYTNKGGVTVESKVEDSKLKIIVKDTGEGLTRDELSKMFESFSRGVAGTRLYTEGVGLGLYIARKFIEMHDGRIWAESKGRNKGSVFYIELPIK